MNFLLDTCVLSELTLQKPNQKVVSWIDSLEDQNTYISAITIGEIKKGAERLAESKRKKHLQTWLDDLIIRFDANIVPLDTEVLLVWGTLTAALDASGNPITALDSLIAASAKTHSLTFATRNTRDFRNTGIKLFDPWK